MDDYLHQYYLNTNIHVKLFSDSHGRWLAGMLGTKLGPYCWAVGLVKPNAGTQIVLENLDRQTKDLRKEDYVVIIAGTNDLLNGKKVEEVVFDLKCGIESVKQGKVLLCTVPPNYHRKELKSSLVELNSSLWKMEGERVRIIDTWRSKRFHFTRHGLHFNLYGKEWLSRYIAKAIFFDVNDTSFGDHSTQKIKFGQQNSRCNREEDETETDWGESTSISLTMTEDNDEFHSAFSSFALDTNEDCEDPD